MSADLERCAPPRPLTLVCNGDPCVSLSNNLTFVCACSPGWTSHGDTSPVNAQHCLINEAASAALWVWALLVCLVLLVFASAVLHFKRLSGRKIFAINQPDAVLAINRWFVVEGIFGVAACAARLGGAYVGLSAVSTTLIGLSLLCFWCGMWSYVVSLHKITVESLRKEPSFWRCQGPFWIRVVIPLCGMVGAVSSLVPILGTVSNHAYLDISLTITYSGFAFLTLVGGTMSIVLLVGFLSDVRDARDAHGKPASLKEAGGSSATGSFRLHQSSAQSESLKQIVTKGNVALVFVLLLGALEVALMLASAALPLLKRVGAYTLPVSLAGVATASLFVGNFVYNHKSVNTHADSKSGQSVLRRVVRDFFFCCEPRPPARSDSSKRPIGAEDEAPLSPLTTTKGKEAGAGGSVVLPLISSPDELVARVEDEA